MSLRLVIRHTSSIIISLCAIITLCFSFAAAQSDVRRDTVAITYPLDQTINVRFRGTTALPRLKGEAKVRRTARRGTRVELNIDNLPRPFELGGPYTTYILWAITPEGRVDSLGEIKRSGSFIFNSKVDVTTPLQTLALIVTAEPHFLVRTPSRMVVLENLPPRTESGAEVATINVQYIGNTSDYFETANVPELADQTYARTPVSLLGARQAVALAKYAGASRDATTELREAEAQLESAENAWRLKSKEVEVDQLARSATSLAARAEEVAEARKAARARREEISRRDAAVREAEKGQLEATEEITRLKDALAREQREREIAERDLANSNQQLRDARSEIARLRDEIQTAQSAATDAQVRLARMEGERAAEDARRRDEQRRLELQTAMTRLREILAQFGTVRDAEGGGLTLVLPETMWANPRAAQLAPSAANTLDPLASFLARNPGLRVAIESHTDDRGTEDALQSLTQERADRIGGQFIAAGVEAARVQAAGLGATRPVSSNRTVATRARNRRVELTFIPSAASVPDAASADGTAGDGTPK